MRHPTLIRLTFFCLCFRQSAQKVCTLEQQQTDRVAKDMIESPVDVTTQTNVDFKVKLHWGPMDKHPYTHEVFEVGCGDRSTTVESNEGVVSAFTNNCFYQGGVATQGTGNTPGNEGCDTWVELSWNDDGSNYTLLSLNSKGEPLWVVHSILNAQAAMDVTNCYAPTETECAARNQRHNCAWQPPGHNPTLITGSNQANGRCAGNNAVTGFLDQNFHGPIDLNPQLGSQANQPGVGSGQGSSWYAGTLKEYASQGQQLQGTDRISFILFKNDVPDHPPVPWLPVPANLHLSYKSQFIKPVGVQWYWTHGLDKYGLSYTPHACSIVPSKAVWNESVSISFDCVDCQARIRRTTGSLPLGSSDTDPSKAWDGKEDTSYGAWDPSGVFVRAELERPVALTRIRFRPVQNAEGAMLNGRFHGLPKHPATTEEVLAVITQTPNPWPQWTELYIHHTTTQFHYVTYNGPAGSHGRVADIEVFYKCLGSHSTETNVVKAVRAGEDCSAPAVYGTTEDRTDLECLFRPSDECYAHNECLWDTAQSLCRQKIPASRRSFTFTGDGNNVQVNFCYEGKTIWPNGTLTLNPPTTPTPTIDTPTPASPPSMATLTPPIIGPPVTPYPVYTSPPNTPAPATGAPQPTAVPAVTQEPTLMPATWEPQPTAQPTEVPPVITTRPPLTPSMLALKPVSNGEVYGYLHAAEWVCTSDVPCRTVILTPVEPANVVGVLGSVQCRLLDSRGVFRQPPFGKHSTDTTLTGTFSTMDTGRAVFLEMTASMPYQIDSTFKVGCTLTANGVVGVEYIHDLLVKSDDGSSSMPRSIFLRLGAEGPADLQYIKNTIARHLNINTALVSVTGSTARKGVTLQVSGLKCTPDPSTTRSVGVYVQVPEQKITELLKLVTNTTSEVSRDLCGVMEAFASHDFGVVFPGPGLPLPGTSGPSGVTVSPSSSGASPPPSSSNGDTVTTVVLVVFAVAVAFCLFAVCGFFYVRRRGEEKGRKDDPHPDENHGARATATVSAATTSEPPMNPILWSFPDQEKNFHDEVVEVPSSESCEAKFV
eukprot:TRINITY_DN33551_c0_g1_i1.p1 TRINITY_DN33551_c0_g1~~TRINITY_DN33551_c0_g1_i1.p1  ORF type:complete len:1069 (+),score=215.16 TRINITY_DN33551_c0_g1_i1:64-3207(+)